MMTVTMIAIAAETGTAVLRPASAIPAIVIMLPRQKRAPAPIAPPMARLEAIVRLSSKVKVAELPWLPSVNASSTETSNPLMAKSKA